MFSPQTRITIKRIIPFSLIWLMFALVYSLIEKGLLGNLNKYPSTGNPYHFGKSILITGLTAWVLGLFMGTVEILLFDKVFPKTSLLKKILYKTAIYIVTIISFLMIITVIYNAVEFRTSVFDKSVWISFWIFFSNFSFWSTELYIAITIGISLLYHEINQNLGQGILNNFFTGKYHSPKEEERIFMFLDMKSSTTIAEDMGHLRYFEMLKQYFSDLTNPIIQYFGEIYQYVGDEIVVTWTLKNGILNNRCIECFFEMKRVIHSQRTKYQHQFGLVPEFKAGLHFGKVITGEIGEIKKEIIFTGDVLNTTARIQSLCNGYGVDLLVSGQLMKKLDLRPPSQMKAMGENELRGRDEKIVLFTILQV
ncbi:MAG TPA: adenylate/guanylate cyclase domain-containing protein [Puia sp.]|nr:adenylate/guanylate cyclase domain-containing protein [Puia sp.]